MWDNKGDKASPRHTAAAAPTATVRARSASQIREHAQAAMRASLNQEEAEEEPKEEVAMPRKLRRQKKAPVEKSTSHAHAMHQYHGKKNRTSRDPIVFDDG